jgi:P27 family predicted phage terminase small subunit
MPAKRLSKEQKQLQGTYRPSRDKPKPALPPSSAPAVKITRPTYLKGDKAARAEWNRLIKELEHTPGLLSGIDASLLAQVCTLYSRWIQAEDEVTRNGLTIEKRSSTKTGLSLSRQKNPAIDVSLSYSRAYLLGLQRLGLTPVDRQRIPTPEPQDTEVDGDLMDQFVNKTGAFAHYAEEQEDTI